MLFQGDHLPFGGQHCTQVHFGTISSNLQDCGLQWEPQREDAALDEDTSAKRCPGMKAQPARESPGLALMDWR